MTRRRTLRTDTAVHPGKVIREWLTERGMTQSDLARRMGSTPPWVSALLSGYVTITPRQALALEEACGISAAVVARMQVDYDLAALRTSSPPSTPSWETTMDAERLDDRLENDIRELRDASPAELAKRLILRGWTLAAPAVTETDPIDDYLASPEAVEQLARALVDSFREVAKSNWEWLRGDGWPAYVEKQGDPVQVFRVTEIVPAILTALRKIRADD